MRTILLTNKYSGIPLKIIQEELSPRFKLCFLPEQTQEALWNEVPTADYILAGGRLKITAEVLERAENLRMVQRSGVGLDALDLDALRAKGIPLYVNQGVNAESVAEHTLLLMLACLRRLPVINQRTKAGVWKKQEQGVQTAELKGKTVGIIGMGHIAKTLVDLLQPFGVRILYYSRTKTDTDYERAKGLRYTGLHELLAASDIVSLHCALTEQTENLIRKETLAIMKPGAIFINTARGGLMDVQALADSLQSGKLSFAALDVHTQEPIPEDYPLKKLENVILTPHIAGITEDSFRMMMHDALRNIACFDQGRLDEIEAYRYL